MSKKERTWEEIWEEEFSNTGEYADKSTEELTHFTLEKDGPFGKKGDEIEIL